MKILFRKDTHLAKCVQLAYLIITFLNVIDAERVEILMSNVTTQTVSRTFFNILLFPSLTFFGNFKGRRLHLYQF